MAQGLLAPCPCVLALPPAPQQTARACLPPGRVGQSRHALFRLVRHLGHLDAADAPGLQPLAPADSSGEPDGWRRAVDAAYAPDAETAFSDGYPISLASEVRVVTSTPRHAHALCAFATFWMCQPLRCAQATGVIMCSPSCDLGRPHHLEVCDAVHKKLSPWQPCYVCLAPRYALCLAWARGLPS